jgi:hypothetical protein
VATAKLKVAQTALVLLFIFTSVYPFNSTQLNAQERQEWEQLVERFHEPRSVRLLSMQLWGQIHGGGLQIGEEMRNLCTLLDPHDGRRPAINTKEFKNRIAAYLNSDNDDEAVFAATLLSVAGDLSFAPQIAKLLDKHASVAFALSFMQAKDYVPRVALMLKGESDYERVWALRALAQFEAKEYAKDVAELLDKDETNRSDALLTLGIMRAKEYQQQVAGYLRDGDEDVRECAAITLVLMGADRYAKRIIPVIRRLYRENTFLERYELHEFRTRFRNSFERMKRRNTLQRSGRTPRAARHRLSLPDSDVAGNLTLLTANYGSLDLL